MATHKTRSTCRTISRMIILASHAKETIQYALDSKQHLIGQSPKMKPVQWRMFQQIDVSLESHVVKNRIAVLEELEGFHSALVHLNILSPRDRWEEWINNYKHEKGCDPAFMCLIIILMSSSTADTQLANIIPHLFSSGETSATAVIDIIQQYGIDCFCCLLSASGRYYQNSERIINAADYFVQRHNGRIPRNISVFELCGLIGIGYKTANIVITTAFRRVEGIPSDIHVIRWCNMLGWCNHNSDGVACSKLLEGWLPPLKWESVNPIFGAFGQLLLSRRRHEILSLARQHPSSALRKLFSIAESVYKR